MLYIYKYRKYMKLIEELEKTIDNINNNKCHMT